MYASLDELKTWIGDVPDGLDDHHLEPIINAAGRWIDYKTGRSFELETAATKLYYPTRDGRVVVTDLITVTSIKTDTRGDRSYATTLATTDYELLPYGEGRYQEVRIWPNSSKAFDPGLLVQIVGNFGYVVDGGPPDEIRLATLILASRWWKRHEMPTGIVVIPDMGSIERVSRVDHDVTLLLAPFTRTNDWVIA